MLRKFLPFLLAVAFAAGALAFYHWSTRSDIPPAECLSVIPADALELILIQRPADLNTKLNGQPAHRRLHAALSWLEVLTFPTEQTEGSEWLSEAPLYFYTPADSTQLVGVFGLPAGWTRQEQEAWCVKHLKAQPQKSGLLTIVQKDNSSLYLRVVNNRCFITANDTPLASVEESTDHPYHKALSMASKADMVHAVAASQRNSMVPILPIGRNHLTVRDLYFGSQQMYGEEIYINEASNFVVHGLPAKWQRLIPEGVESFEGLGFDAGADFVAERLRNLADDAERATWNGRLADLETQYATDAELALTSWWNLGLARYQAFGNSYLLIGAADGASAAAGLKSTGARSAEPLLNGQMIAWDNPEFLRHLLGKLFDGFSIAWSNDSYVIFAQDQATLLKLVSRLGSGQVIGDDHLVSRALFRGESFIRYERRQEDFRAILDGLTLPAYPADAERTSTHLLWSGIKSDKGQLITRFDLSPAETAIASASFQWESLVAGLRADRISAVKNHTNGEYYLLIQDTLNVVHAIDAHGKSMWKYSAEQEVIGNFESIDALKNGKIQVLFATSNGIHCVDLLGRAVAGFPLSVSPRGAIRSEVTSTLLVADYDNNKNYRLIFATADGKIHNYKADGTATSGWNYASTGEAAVYMHHLKAGNADFIFAGYINGQVALLKRNGEVRHQTKLQLPSPYSPPAFRMANDISASSVLVCDTSGSVIDGRFGNGGAPEMRALGQAQNLILGDLTRDRSQDLILVNGNVLSAFDAQGQKIFERDFRSPVHPDIRFYQFSTGSRVGVVLPALGELHLIEGDGATADGFPLFSGGPCVIRDFNNDGKLEVVTTDGSGMVMCYTLP
jgi:hypothetical protein